MQISTLTYLFYLAINSIPGPRSAETAGLETLNFEWFSFCRSMASLISPEITSRKVCGVELCFLQLSKRLIRRLFMLLLFPQVTQKDLKCRSYNWLLELSQGPEEPEEPQNKPTGNKKSKTSLIRPLGISFHILWDAKFPRSEGKT